MNENYVGRRTILEIREQRLKGNKISGFYINYISIKEENTRDYKSKLKIPFIIDVINTAVL